MQFSNNLIAQLFYQLSVYLAPLISTPYLSRVLGSSMIGRVSYAQSIASYFILAAGFGTATYGQRIVASQQKDPAAQWRAFCDIVFLRTLMAVICGMLYYFAIVPKSADPKVSLFTGVEILSVAADISWYYQGSERFHIIALSNGITRCLLIILLFLFVKTPSDVAIYAALHSCSILLCALSQWLFLPKGQNLGEHRPESFLDRGKIHINGSFSLFAAQLAMQVYTVLDKTMIGLITKLESENGYYDQAQRLIRLLESCCTVVSPVITSRVAVLWHQERQDEALSLLKRSIQFVCCIGVPTAIGLQLVASDFVPIYYGASYEPVIALLQILSALPLVIGISNVIGIQFLVPTGREQILTLSVSAGAVVNIILNLFLITEFKSFGAALASVIAEITVTGIQLHCVRSEIRFREVIHTLFHYVFLCVPMFLCGVLLHLTLSPGKMRLIMTITACIVVYWGCLYLAKDPLLRFVREALHSRFHRNTP